VVARADTASVNRNAVARGALALGALGVVFGDIGTSPLYTVKTVFNPDDPHPVAATTDAVFGVISLIFWSVTLIVTVTYVPLVMRADNDGLGTGAVGRLSDRSWPSGSPSSAPAGCAASPDIPRS
jgi:KUP system potassium uptake protein